MEYYIGSKREKVKFEYFLGDGEEGNVFKYGNEAIKIYFYDWQHSTHNYLSEEEALKMTEIRSRQILLPRRLVYNTNDEFCGYSTALVNNIFADFNYSAERNALDRLFLSSIRRKIQQIYEEMYYLSSRGILLHDLLFPTENYIYNGKFWLIDPGCYVFSSKPFEEIVEENIKTLNNFFISNIFLLGEDFSLIANVNDNDNRYTVPDYLKFEGKAFERTLSFRNRMR